MWMPGEQYFENFSTQFVYLSCVVVNDHAVSCWFAAGGNNASSAFYLYLAQPASAERQLDVS
jgi:hypothetical protein